MDSKVIIAAVVGLGIGLGGGIAIGTNISSGSGDPAAIEKAEAGTPMLAENSARPGKGDGEDRLERRRRHRERMNGERGMRMKDGDAIRRKGMKDIKDTRQRGNGEDPAAIYKIPVGDAPVLGPADAKITIVEVSDYECPFCAKANVTVNQLMQDYAGSIRVAMKQHPLPFHKHAMDGALAALAAGEQGKYWEMHQKMFEATAAKTPLTREKLEELAGEIGLNVDAFKAAMDDGRFAARIGEEMKQANALGARGTPAFFINGRKISGNRPIEQFKAVIDEELKRADETLAKGVAADKLYDELIKDGSDKPVLLPGAKEPSNPFAGTGPAKDVPVPATSPSAGPDGAKVTIVEFLDFQCPHCAKAAGSVKQLMGDFPNDVKVVFRHQPLGFHPGAKPAALASMAAHKQGKFWEMEQKLFQAGKDLTKEGSIEAIAAETGLDMDAFKADWKGAEVAALVDADMADAKKLGVTGTPTMFINGRTLIGARPYESLKALVEEELAKGAAPAAPEAPAAADEAAK